MPQTQLNGRDWIALNQRQRTYLKLYLGDSKIAGNATRCYMAAYSQENVQCAQRSASKLMTNPHIKALIAKVEAAAFEQLQVDAAYVLDQSVRLLDRAMGDESVEVIETHTDADGSERVSVTQRRDYDPATAKAALQLIGQHRQVQAFQVTVEHNHTHHLEQRLAARSKLIEGRAQVIDDPPALASDDPAQVQQLAHVDPAPAHVDITDHDQNSHTPKGEGGQAPAAPAGHTSKRVHAGGGQEERARAQEKTSAERAGATAD